jgi:hypothetical protein
MVLLPEAAGKVLAANPGETYCVDCLAQAAGFTLEEQRLSLDRLIRRAARKTGSRLVRRGVCSVCGRGELIATHPG